jgi:hypothetical protein
MVLATYRELGTLTSPNHALEVNGMAFIFNVEGGSGDTFVPFEIYSDYSGTTDTTLGRSRQLRFRVNALNGQMAPSGNSSIATCDMGINYEADYFFITRPTIEISRPHGDFVIDYLGNVGINTTQPSGYNLRVDGTADISTLSSSTSTTDTLTVNTSLTSQGVLEAGGNVIFSSNSSNDNVAIDIGDGRYFSAPLLYWGQSAAQVASLLNGPSGLNATLSVGDSSETLGVNARYIRTLNPSDATAFAGTTPSAGWVETVNLLALGDAEFQTHVGIGASPGGTSGLTISSDATTQRGLKHLYGIVEQYEYMDSLGGLHFIPTALNVQNTMSFNVGSMSNPQRDVSVWTNSGFFIPDLSGAYDTFSLIQPNVIDATTYPVLNFMTGREGVSYLAWAAIGVEEGDSQTGNARFSHITQNNDTSYALRQTASGATYVNVPTGQTGYLNVNNTKVMDWDSAGIDVNGTILFTSTAAGIRAVTGDYGSVQTEGSKNGWAGYSIGGYATFMSNASTTGIYNDAQNEWMLTCDHNGACNLYHDNTNRFWTTSNGAYVNTVINVGSTIQVGGQNIFNGSTQFIGAGGVNTAGAISTSSTITATGAVSTLRHPCRPLGTSTRMGCTREEDLPLSTRVTNLLEQAE